MSRLWLLWSFGPNKGVLVDCKKSLKRSPGALLGQWSRKQVKTNYFSTSLILSDPILDFVGPEAERFLELSSGLLFNFGPQGHKWPFLEAMFSQVEATLDVKESTCVSIGDLDSYLN